MHIVLPVSVAPRALFALAYTPASLVEDSPPRVQEAYTCPYVCDAGAVQADICQLGMDQRKVNMLARDQAGAMGLARPPVILSHPMMPGLKEGQAKMSKSHPDTAIFMEDSREDVARKIAKAHCPPGVEEGNPCLVYLKCIVFPFAVKAGRPVVITDERTGVVAAAYDTYRALADAYVGGSVHPKDLKACLVAELNGLLEPTRRHFATNPAAARLLAQVQELTKAPSSGGPTTAGDAGAGASAGSA